MFKPSPFCQRSITLLYSHVQPSTVNEQIMIFFLHFSVILLVLLMSEIVLQWAGALPRAPSPWDSF